MYYGPGRCLSKLPVKHLAGLSVNCKASTGPFRREYAVNHGWIVHVVLFQRPITSSRRCHRYGISWAEFSFRGVLFLTNSIPVTLSSFG